MNETAFLAVFPFLFAALWIGNSWWLGKMSGWFALQESYPDRLESARFKLRSVSGSMGKFLGMPINFGSCLRLEVCHSGVRVSLWKIFGLFSRPFLVPWSDITVSKKSSLLFPQVRLAFGKGSEVGALNIYRRSFDKLAAQSVLRLP